MIETKGVYEMELKFEKKKYIFLKCVESKLFVILDASLK